MSMFLCRNRFLPLLMVGFLGMIAVTPVVAQGKTPAAAMTDAEREKIESVVKDYILSNPEVIIEAIQGLRERDERANREKAQGNLVKLQGELLRDPDSPVGGNPKGDVTVVEFFDYRCGFCKRVFPDILTLMESDKNVRYVYKEYPILGPDSVTASKAALAAWNVDKTKYNAFHKTMMGSKGALSPDRVMKFAAKVGYDVNALKKAMRDPRIESLIEKNFKLAKALDINGTPAFIIGDQVIRGAVDLATLKLLVSKARGS
ncbi:MAG: DsbA family protein [Alphaproteobacteria bacterium]|jgi:protein-disulfide isomerase|nr:DsbA family protein [Alphaproteobacteria bacterium]